MNKDNIIKRVKNLEWKYANNSFIKTFEFRDYDEALNWIVYVVAPICREQNHHPNIMWEFNKVTLVLFTHSEKDVTKLDEEFISTLEKENLIKNQTAKYL